MDADRKARENDRENRRGDRDEAIVTRANEHDQHHQHAPDRQRNEEHDTERDEMEGGTA
jgi:hypothetical protein